MIKKVLGNNFLQHSPLISWKKSLDGFVFALPMEFWMKNEVRLAAAKDLNKSWTWSAKIHHCFHDPIAQNAVHLIMQKRSAGLINLLNSLSNSKFITKMFLPKTPQNPCLFGAVD